MREEGGKTGLMCFIVMGGLFLLTALYTVCVSANITPPQLPVPAGVTKQLPVPATRLTGDASSPTSSEGNLHRLANLADMPPKRTAQLKAAVQSPAAALVPAAQPTPAQPDLLSAKPPPMPVHSSSSGAAKFALAKAGLVSSGSVKHGVVRYDGVKSGHSPATAKKGQLPEASKLGAAGPIALQHRPESAKLGMSGPHAEIKSGKVGLLSSKHSIRSKLVTMTEASRARLAGMEAPPTSSPSEKPEPALEVPNDPEIKKFGRMDKNWGKGRDLAEGGWGKGWKEPFAGTPANMISGYRSRAPPFAKNGILVPPSVKTGFAPGGVKKQRRHSTPETSKQGHAPAPMPAKLGISGGGVKFGLDIVFAKGNGHVPATQKHGRIPVADIVPLATKPGSSPLATKRGVARGGPLPRAVKSGQADGLLVPNWGKSGGVPPSLKGGIVNADTMPHVAAKTGSLHERPWTIKNGKKVFTVKGGMIVTNKQGLGSLAPVFAKMGMARPQPAQPASLVPPGMKAGSLRVHTDKQRLTADVTTTKLEATAVAATLGNPVSTSAVQGMVQGAVNVAATATVAAVPAGTTAATLPVTTAAALPAATTAAAVAAVPVLPAAVPAVTAVAPAQAVGVQVVAEAHGHTKTLSPATPLWAQAMGAHLPAAVALPSTPFPPAMVYVINHRPEDLFFKQAGHVYNVIPAHAVARQSTFGGEDWDIVDAIGQVFKHITITQNNQREVCS